VVFEYDIENIVRNEYQLSSMFTLKDRATGQLVRVFLSHHAGIHYKIGDRFISDEKISDCNSQETSTVPSAKT
jgi:hypothetical protein